MKMNYEQHEAIEKTIKANPGLKYALVALSFFRGRWNERLQYKNAKKTRNQKKTIVDHAQSVTIARKYIRKAREEGYRGYPRRDIQIAMRID